MVTQAVITGRVADVVVVSGALDPVGVGLF